MNEQINPDLLNGWTKYSEEAAPTRCAWFRNDYLVIIVEKQPTDGSHQWRVTLGHRQYDPAVNDTFERKEAALARAEELMLTYKQYVNPTTYTVEIELMRDCEADIDYLLYEGGCAVTEDTDNSVLRSEFVEET